MKHITCTVTNDLTYDQRMQRICGSLVKAGYQVTLVGRKKTDSKILTQRTYQQKRLRCFFNQGKFFYLEYNIRLFVYLLFQRNDFFYAVDLDTIFPNFLISHLKRKPCVYDAHEYFTETPEVVRRKGVQKIWEWVAKICIPRMAHCITVGQGLATIMGKRYGTIFTVVRNVPSYQSNSSVIKTGFSVLLYQGMLNEGRGLERMIEAMEEITEAELWLVGEGDLSYELREMVKDRKLETRIKFLGFVPPEDLKSITEKATIGLNLLENRGFSYYYSLANKAFDYVQAGIPSIHMNFPEYRHLNERHEVFCLVEDLKVDTLQNAVWMLLEDRKYYEKLKGNCKIAEKEWCWEREEAILLDLFQDY